MDRGNHSYIMKDDRGQTLVEFALIVILLLAILFGIMEFGRAWFYSNDLTNGVRAAARYGAVLYPFDADRVDAYLRDEIAQHMDDTKAITSITVFDKDDGSEKSPETIRRGDTIEVTVTYNFDFLVGSYFLEIFSKGATWPLTRSASIQYEEGK